MKKYQLDRYDEVRDPLLAAVRVSGEVDIECAPQLREELERLLEAECCHLLVDIEEVRHLDSYSLGAFVGVRQRARTKGGTLNFTCHNPLILRLFSMTNLDKLFDFYESVDAFVAACGSGTGDSTAHTSESQAALTDLASSKLARGRAAT